MQTYLGIDKGKLIGFSLMKWKESINVEMSKAYNFDILHEFTLNYDRYFEYRDSTEINKF